MFRDVVFIVATGGGAGRPIFKIANSTGGDLPRPGDEVALYDHLARTTRQWKVDRVRHHYSSSEAHDSVEAQQNGATYSVNTGDVYVHLMPLGPDDPMPAARAGRTMKDSDAPW